MTESITNAMSAALKQVMFVYQHKSALTQRTVVSWPSG